MSNVQHTSESARPARLARTYLAGAGIVGVALVAAACGGSSTATGSAAQPAVVASTPAARALLGTSSTPLGTILVDGQGRTVYEFASDSKNTSTCSGQCLSYWPLVSASSIVPSTLPGVTGTIGSITRTDGGKQLTINGLPLYTYAGDTAPGMTSGQGSIGSGAKWWVVAPNGTPITSTG